MLKKLTSNKIKKNEEGRINGGSGLGVGWFLMDLCDGYCYQHCGEKDGMASKVKSGQDTYQK